MSDPLMAEAARSDEPGRRLDAWKEIAAYLKRDVTTVRRWERREGLPVHRHRHDKLGSVYAFTKEIDDWCRQRGEPVSPSTEPPPPLGGSSAGARAPTWPRWMLAGGVLAAIAAWLIIGADVAPPDATADAAPMSLAIPAPADGGVASLAISPDGRRLAYASGRAGDVDRLWIRRLDSTVAEPLAGTAGASYPFWSPDGQRLGFFADGRLKTIAIDTREIADLADAPVPRGGTWSARGMILFGPDRGRPLSQVPASGGLVTQATAIDDRYRAGHAWPEFLPDGHRFLFLDYDPRRDRHGIYVGDLDSAETRRLVAAYSSASYSTSGDLIYVARELVAQHLDLETLTMTGPLRTLAIHVAVRESDDHKAEFSMSRTGVLALRAPESSRRRVVWLDRRGRQTGAIGDAAGYSSPTISPDGRSILLSRFDSDDGPMYPWRLDVATGTGTRLTAGAGLEVSPIWSRRGDRIVFGAIGNGHVRFLEASPLPGAIAEGLCDLAPLATAENWTPDGQTLLLTALRPTTKADVLLWSRSTRALTPWLATPANEVQARVSPDGRSVAYASDESGRYEIYVRGFAGSAGTWRVSDTGGADPRWHPDGRTLYYIRPDGTIVEVALRTAAALERHVGTPLFDIGTDGLWAEARNHYDVARDGRIVTLRPVADSRQTPFTLMVNWRVGSK
ncbi:MAG TPA: hypothetical protein VFO19_13940 [Vicinamibacterales bacterium]|nr:hypothetical protein [Vicinamibacterales bacterium]